MTDTQETTKTETTAATVPETPVETGGDYAAPTVDTSSTRVHEGPFNISDKELRRADRMQGLFFGTVTLFIIDGILNLVLVGRVSTAYYFMFLVIFAILFLAALAVCLVSFTDSTRIRNKNAVATIKWVADKYGLELTAKQAHILDRNEVVIGSTRGWDKLTLQGYPNGVQITHAPKHGYRLITTNGENDSELPRARSSRFAGN